jgi:hypothetical protein
MNTQPIKLCARTDIPEGEMIEMSVPGTDNSLLLVSTCRVPDDYARS